MSNQETPNKESNDSDRYNNDSQDQQQDTGRYATTDTVQNDPNKVSENSNLATDLTTMVENINTDLTTLYQEINQHINEQLAQVKESSQDIQSLMSNLNEQLKNSQKK
jgi:hypothetical protein